VNRRYRVAMVAACPFPCPRGTPIRVRRMAEALTARGHDVHVVTYHFGQQDEPLPFPVHRTPCLSYYRRLAPGPTLGKLVLMDPMLAGTLRRLLTTRRFDVIHAHHYEGLMVARWARGHTRIPIVYDAHTLLETELPYYPLGLPRAVKRAIGRVIDRTAPRRSDHVVAVSDTIRDLLIDPGWLPADRVSVVPSGVELDLFQQAPDRVGWHNRAPELVFAGNLAPYQRIDLLIRSFRTVVDARPDARLVLVGSASLAEYDELANQLGVGEQIRTVPSDFRGLPAHLAAADIALNPRTACGGMPQKLLNYMAAGKPIVSFAGSGGVLEHGRTAWLVPDEDVHAFGGGVLHLLGQPRLAAELGANARRQVMQEYNWGRVADLVEAVYDRVTNGRVR
jgi:glycosyltransferase involved in cell wall biosynthesis